jgi:hypothetical protein
MKAWKLAVALAVVLAMAGLAIGQRNIEGPDLRVNSVGYTYKPLIGNDDASTATVWSLDSAVTDTSAAYKIIPGSFVAISLSVGATTDTLDQVYIYGSMTGSPADWVLLDSIGAVDGEDGPIEEMRYVHGPANGSVGAATPVLCRYVHLTAANHDGANAAAANVVTGYIVSSPPPAGQ